MSTLEEKLKLAKSVSKAEKQLNTRMPMDNQSTLNESEYLMYNPTQEKPKPYNADDDLKRIQQGLPSDLSNCKLPKSILESIVKNPLNGMSVDPQMDHFTEALSKNLGINQATSLMEKLEKIDNKKTISSEEVVKRATPTSVENVSIDYDKIKQIVEEVIDEKLSNLNTSDKGKDVTVIKFGTDKFLFLDSDNNIYECVMKYKGKNKKRQ